MSRTARPRWILVTLIVLLLCTCFPAVAEVSPEQLAELRPLVEQQLESPQKDVRRLAIMTLGEMIDDKDKKALKAYQAYLENPDPIVKEAAIVALSQRGDKAGLKALKLALSPEETGDLAKKLEALLKPLESSTQQSVLKDLLKKTASDAHRVAFVTYISTHGDPTLFALLEPVAKLKSPESIAAVIDALRKQPRKEALGLARLLAKSKVSATRLKTLELARAIDTTESRALIADALNDSDDGVKKAAEKHLIELHHPAVVPALEARVKQDPKDLDAIKHLLAFDNVDLVETLTPLVASENPAMEQAEYNQVMAVIASSKSQAASDLINARLKSTYTNDRIAAAHAIRFTEDQAFTPTVNQLLFDGSPLVRAEAAAAMIALKDSASIEPINKALNGNYTIDVKVDLLRALGAIGEKDSAKFLQFHVMSPETPIRLAAIDAIVALGARDMSNAIELAASDGDAAVSWHATVALFRLDPTVYTVQLSKALPQAPKQDFFDTLDTLDDATRKKLQEQVFRGNRADLSETLLANASKRLEPDDLTLVRFAYDNSPSETIRRDALNALSRKTLPDDIDRFKKVAEHPNRPTRLLALTSLLRYDPAQTQDVFTKASTDADPLIQVMGIYGLVR